MLWLKSHGPWHPPHSNSWIRPCMAHQSRDRAAELEAEVAKRKPKAAGEGARVVFNNNNIIMVDIILKL